MWARLCTVVVGVFLYAGLGFHSWAILYRGGLTQINGQPLNYRTVAEG